MLKRRTGVALAAVLLTTVSPALPLAAQGAKASVCDPETPAANLNFTLRDMDGKSVTLSQFKGKVILLNFWATWCGPCKIEIPGFVKLYQTYRGQGLLAGVTSTDIVYDLGCGDGRIAIAAARKHGARAVGVDSDPERIALATANAAQAGVSHLVRFVRQDTIDFSEATVVTLAMPQSAPWLTNFGLIAETLGKRLRPGSRVVSTFLPGSLSLWKATRVDRYAAARGEPRAILYLWNYNGEPPR